MPTTETFIGRRHLLDKDGHAALAGAHEGLGDGERRDAIIRADGRWATGRNGIAEGFELDTQRFAVGDG